MDGTQQLNRVIEESVPGKQVTIAHVIAAPVGDIYERLGIDNLGAIGILTLSLSGMVLMGFSLDAVLLIGIVQV